MVRILGQTKYAVDEIDTALLEFWDLPRPGKAEDAHPIFGSSHRIESLSDGFTDALLTLLGEEGSAFLPPTVQKTLPTLSNLAYHFGYGSDLINAFRDITGPSRPLVPRLTKTVLKETQKQFEHEHIEFLRNYLEKQSYPVYLYCVPATSPDKRASAGKLIRSTGPMVVAPIPSTSTGAKHYNQTDEEIQLFADQALWLIRKFCAIGKITEQQQLLDAINAWRAYIDPLTLLVYLDHLQADYPRVFPIELQHTLLAPMKQQLQHLQLPPSTTHEDTPGA